MRYEDTSGTFSSTGTPEARDDADAIPAGRHGPATGNVITGTGTTTGKAGADSPNGAHVVELRGAGGTDSEGTSLNVEGRYGTLSMDANGNYKYVPMPQAPDNVRDLFQYTLANAKGRDSADLVVLIGDGAVKISANAQRVVPGPDGLVTLPPGVDLSDVHVVGRDLVVTLPDGSQIIIVDGAVFVPQLVVGGVEVPATNLAALLIEAEPRPAAGPPQSSGGNFAVDVPPLDPGVPYGDLIPPTAFGFPEPTVEEVANAIEEEEGPPTVIIITPDFPAGAVNASESVNEKGLPTRNEGESPGSGEIADGNASNNSDTTETNTGSIVFTTPDGFGSISINGTVITGINQAIPGLFGTLTITGFNPSTGSVTYSYTLADNTSGDATHDDFAIVVTDEDGDTAAGTLTVNIIDDVPTAHNDSGAQQSQDAPITVNVVANDVFGADGVTNSNVAFVAGSLQVSPGQTAGTVVYNNNGTFTYIPSPGQEGSVTFQYRITDGDGDTSVATVTITLLPDAVPTISVSGDQSVNEAGLPSRPGESEGSGEQAAPGANGDPSETATGTINVNTGNDTVGSLIINGVNVTNGGVVNGASGTLTVTFSAGVYSYSYTLTDNTSGDATTDTFSVTVTDSDGDTASTSLVISIVDDVPTAHNDSGNQTVEGAPVTVNVINNDVPGADSVNLTSGVALVAGSLTGTGSVVYNNNGTFTYTPGAGEEGTVIFQYRITDGDGDTSVATVTITLLADSTPTIGVTGDNSVNEAGLPSRPGESEGSGEFAAPGANGDPSETATGNINITTGNDTVASLIINGVNVTGGGVVNTASGTLTVTFGGGVYSYSYTLNDNTSGDSTTDTFSLQVTDSDGDTASTSLVISIVDDVPTANNDSGNQLVEGAPVTVNVINNDVPGADSVNLTTGVALVGGSLTGTGGVVYNNDGTFTYTPGAGEEGTVTFQYRITDGDGDTSVATVTITLLGDSTPTVGVTGDQSVNEAGLPSRPGESEGSGEEAAPGANGDPSETATGTIDITTGNDTLGSVIINGIDVTGGGVVNTASGTLTITVIGGVYNYSYTLNDNTSGDATTDTFSITVADNEGDTASTSLIISIVDDVPTARDDSGSQLVEDAPVTVNVITNDTPGADSVNLTTGVALVPGSLTGTGGVVYNNDGTFTYTPGAGEEGTVTFQYRITDGDGDTSIATVTITLLGDSTPTIGVTGDNSVNEAGLPSRPGEPEGSGEEAAPGANGDPSETATGNINITTGNDTVASLIINGVNVTGGGVVNTATGALTVTFSAGVYSYSYTLADNTSGDSTTDTFNLQVTDSDGDTATTSLVISIVDDVPTARNDTDTVAAGTFGPESGNVITGVGTTSGAPGADTLGADNASVVSITGAGGTDTTFSGGFLVIAGTYGSLQIDANGGYSYTRNAGTPGGVTDTFTYKLQDGDGDTSSATLIITINDAGVTTNIPPAGGATTTVFEAGLPARSGESEGSGEQAAPGANGDPSEAVSGTIGFTAIDGLASISLGGTAINLAGPFPQTMVTNATGTLVVTGVTYNPATGAGTISYTYTLADNTSGDATNVSFALVVTDADGDTSPPGNLVINITDDVPTANNDNGSQLTENASVTVNVINNDVQGADSVNLTTGVALVGGSLTGTGSVLYNNDGTFTYTPGAGEEGTVTFQYRITDGDGDTSVATVTITLLADSVPQPTNAVAAVDDDGLAGGNTPGGTGDIDATVGSNPASATETVFNGSISVNFGNDTGTVDFSNLNGTFVQVGTERIALSWSGTTLTGTVAAVGFDLVTPQARAGTNLFTVSLSPSGSYTVTLLDNVLHAAGGNETSTTLDLFYRAADSDGDVNTSGKLTITFNDDTPTFTAAIQNQQTDNNTGPGSVATGTLHFAPGADGAGAAMTITANLTGITSGGKAIVTNQVGNVLTGYQDVGPAGYDAGDTTVVFTLTVNPTAGTSGQYVFDLVTPLDLSVVDTPIGGTTSFGAGPAPYQVVSATDVNVDPLAILTGWHTDASFDAAAWYAGTNVLPAGVTHADINGSTSGWGVDNNNFTAGEFIRWDFGEPPDDFDGVGGYAPPNPAVDLPAISTATFEHIGYVAGDTIQYVVHYTDGSTDSYTFAGNVQFVTLVADTGKFIDWIDTYTPNAGSGKIDIVSVGRTTTSIDKTIPFTLQLTDGDGDTTTVQNFTVQVKTGLSPNPPAPPVVLDLNGDGVQFLSIDDGVTYDYGNGHVATAWASPQDGILALDANHNGTVDDASEFVFGGDGVTDLEALAAYDSNHDGVLDAGDAAFKSFVVWQDANSNGVSDAGEVSSLTALGITSISLSSDGIAYEAAGGDVAVAGTGSYTKADGSTGLLADAAFRTGLATNSNAVLMGALAAAGLAAESMASATATASIAASLASTSLTPVHNAALAPIALDAVAASSSADLLPTAIDVNAMVNLQGSTFMSHTDVTARAMLDDGIDAVQGPTALLEGMSMPMHNSAMAQAPMTAAAVAMPSAEMLAGFANASDTGPAQHNAIVGKVLVEALDGGSAQGQSIDALLNSLPGHGGAQAGLEALATHAGAAVSNTDIASFAGFTAAHTMFTMEHMVIHQDAAPHA